MQGAGTQRDGESYPVPSIVMSTEHYNRLARLVDRRKTSTLEVNVKTKYYDEPISTVMTADVVVTAPGGTVEDMMRLMTERRIRHVPVVTEDGQLAGIISIGDVVKSRIDELEADRDQLIGYIHSSR